MNADQLKGKWLQFKGELKQKYGKFTDDDLTQIEGNYDKFVGKAQERYGDKKDELMKWADEGISDRGLSLSRRECRVNSRRCTNVLRRMTESEIYSKLGERT